MNIYATAEQDICKHYIKLLDGEKKRITVDFSAWQEDCGETITGISWSGSVEDLEIDGNTSSAVIGTTDCYVVTATTLNLVKKTLIRVGCEDEELPDYV